MNKTAKRPTIIDQHEYISINFGNNRRLTTSYSGEKAAGAIPDHVFKAWLKMVDDFRKGPKTALSPNPKSTPFLDVIQKFADDIDTMWPEWNKAPRVFTVGESVVFNMGSRRGGMDKGVVTKVRGTSVTVKWERSGLIGMTADMLEEHNKKETCVLSKS